MTSIFAATTKFAHRPQFAFYTLLLSRDHNKNRMTFKVRYKLMRFIERLSGPVIGFYCYDLFPMTTYEFTDYILDSMVSFLLIVKFLKRCGFIWLNVLHFSLWINIIHSKSSIYFHLDRHLEPPDRPKESQPREPHLMRSDFRSIDFRSNDRNLKVNRKQRLVSSCDERTQQMNRTCHPGMAKGRYS